MPKFSLSLSLSLMKLESNSVIWWADDPNNLNQNINQNSNQENNSDSESKEDNNSNQKCSKCPNDATHDLTIQITNTQNSETHLLCDPCYQSFIKCRECKNNEITTATLKNNQKIYVCSECNQKLKDQQKQEKIAQEYKTKLNKILAFVENERYFSTVEKAIKTDKLTLEQLKELKTLLIQIWESDTDNSHSIWNETVYVCPFIEHYLNILDPKIKDLETNLKCKECSQNLTLPFITDYKTDWNTHYCFNCWAKIEKDFRFFKEGDYKGLSYHVAWHKTDLKTPTGEVRWVEDKKAWIAFTGDEIVYQPSQEEQEPTPQETPNEPRQESNPNEPKPNSIIEIGSTESQPKNRSETKNPNQKANNPAERNQPTPTNNSPHPDNERIWGSDFGQLKPQQRESRIEVNNNYKENKEKLKTRSLCSYCSKEFFWETTEENFLPAQQEAKNRLENHKKSCSLKNDKNKQKQVNQKSWDQVRKTKQRRFKTCQKCHKKVIHDKNILDYEQANKNCQKRLNIHKKECGTKPENEYSIMVVLTVGQNSETIESNLNEQDELGQVYQEQTKKTNWGLIGGVGLVGLGIIGLGFYFWNKRKAKKES